MSTAVELFYTHGYAQTSVGDIAEATGLLKGSLYYYIESKEDLLYRVVNEVHEISQTQLADALSDVTRPAIERLVDFTRAQLLYNARHHTHVAVYHHEWHRLEGDRLDEVRRRRHSYDHDLAALIEQARDQGDLPAGIDVRLLANSILAIICWPYTWYRPETMPAEQLADFGADFVRAALRGASE